MKISDIGIIGVGVVGNALRLGMRHAVKVETYDRVHARSSRTSISELVAAVNSRIYFICVPTPMTETGRCDISLIESVLEDLAEAAEERFLSYLTVVIKSTVPPGTCEQLREKYGQRLGIAFNPEFLTEAKPIEDFILQDRIILGVHPEDIDPQACLSQLYRDAYPNVPQVQLSLTEAEMVKYVGNCFLATKVSFANEVFDVCQKLGISYDNVIEAAKLDKRLGSSHWKVPGPDGRRGFGLTCFPKDLNALMRTAEDLGIDPLVLKAAWEKNLQVRPERDWEKMKGRAVT